MYLIIYDTSGYILFNGTGDVREPIGIPFLRVDIPIGKRIVSIDTTVTPNIPTFEDIPKTETDIMKQQISDLNIAIANMIGV